MKKNPKGKDHLMAPEAQADIAGLILKVQQQLSFLDKKMDTLLARAQERPSERTDRPKPFQSFSQAPRREDTRPGSNYGERILHKAVCAECRKECEVPFKPSGDRPVYCKECFSKRKVDGPFRPNFRDHSDKAHPRRGFIPGSAGPGREDFKPRRAAYKRAGVENRKPYEKKKPGFARRKRSS